LNCGEKRVRGGVRVSGAGWISTTIPARVGACRDCGGNPARAGRVLATIRKSGEGSGVELWLEKRVKMGENGGKWGEMGGNGEKPPGKPGKFREIQGNSGKFREIQGNSGKFREIQGNSRKFRTIPPPPPADSARKLNHLTGLTGKFSEKHTELTKLMWSENAASTPGTTKQTSDLHEDLHGITIYTTRYSCVPPHPTIYIPTRDA